MVSFSIACTVVFSMPSRVFMPHSFINILIMPYWDNYDIYLIGMLYKPYKAYVHLLRGGGGVVRCVVGEAPTNSRYHNADSSNHRLSKRRCTKKNRQYVHCTVHCCTVLTVRTDCIQYV